MSSRANGTVALLSRDEIQAFVRAVTEGAWPEDPDTTALLMAIVLRGMTARRPT